MIRGRMMEQHGGVTKTLAARKSVGTGLSPACTVKITGAPRGPLDVMEILNRSMHGAHGASAVAGGMQMVINSLRRQPGG